MQYADTAEVYGKGHILSRRLIRAQGEQYVELWLATEMGLVCLLSEPQYNVCFADHQDRDRIEQLLKRHQLAVSIQDTHLKTLTQRPLCLLKVNHESDLYELRRLCEEAQVTLYEADIKLVDRFLMERFAYGSVSYKAIRSNSTNSTFIDAKVKGAVYRPALTTLSIDIECDENESLYSVGLAGPDLNHVLLIHKQTVNTDNTRYTLETVPDERTLLTRLCQLVQSADPDVITGWNVKQFDFAVLARRAAKLNVTLTLGRDNQVLQVKNWSSGQTWVELPGRAVIDGIEALKTMTYQFDSFSLDNVAARLLNTGKLVKEHDQLAAIKALYHDDPTGLADYNFQDCELVNQIAHSTNFIDFLVLRSTLTGLELSRLGGSVAAFINVYLPHLHRGGYISGNRPDDGGLASPGGYVMDSKPGLYDHVLVLDFKSLYPSIIRTFKIDPMGLAEGLLTPDNAIPGFKGACFSRTKHYLPDIIANLWRQRDEAKKQNDAPRSQAIKILMNSFYGVLGSGGCPFYDPRLASSITIRGHEIMQTTAQWVEASGHEVIYGDTDSLFITLSGIPSRQEAIQIGLQLEQEINKRWQKHLKINYQLDCSLELEFETCYDKFFMPTIRGAATGSKKRYAGLVTDGDNNQSLIFKGLESVRSDWTQLAKVFQETLYLNVFTEQPVIPFIKQTLTEIRTGKRDAELVYKKRLRKPLTEYTRSRPPHVKAALLLQSQKKPTEKSENTFRATAIHYVITLEGPQPIDHVTSPLDYEHYIEKQIQPIADSILPYVDLSFEQITADQMDLF
ncbi:DNA polymerase II [Salinimonas sp. HHU 13199]|uniref:DNA polymerase n=1 Tax=Salinimonas profundi TaxID=2729140 RepID=A0ABR8LPF7_9ALTE|nr:DNA polymerase II [Salinimonas profundi]